MNIERRPGNLVLVTESIEPNLAVALNAAILKANVEGHHSARASAELTSRYLNSPIFADVRSLWDARMLVQMGRETRHRLLTH